MKTIDMPARIVAIPMNPMLRYNTGVPPGYLMRTVLELITDEGIVEYEAKVIEKIPDGFIAEPENSAPTVTSLASDAAGYITGASIFVDGGLWL